ncbi:uncharacterized protein LOC111630733 [Centruroides sculpturatus]|uniref:uncharacterized protein LOC111630733 n=1 Tax=Centruroides sculpturatus TaxID=218467 RepID=UPI000C6EB13E|nr:uncharacterized protein LOC111630733 [Centruroides sculpturatus]
MDFVRVICKDKQEIMFSRSILSKESARISAMLRRHSNVQVMSFYLPYSTDILQQIHEYLEEGRTNITSTTNAINLLFVTTRLLINRLSTECRKYVIKQLTSEDVCHVYDFADQNKDVKLLFICWKKFDSDWHRIFNSEKWLDCSGITIYRLVSRPIYRRVNEIDIFNVVLQWAKKRVTRNKSLREVMRSFIPKLRFLIMPPESLECMVFNEPILTDLEKDAIRCYFQTNETWFLPQNICTIECPRSEDQPSMWFSYCKQRHRSR